jgi:hypothetical protein
MTHIRLEFKTFFRNFFKSGTQKQVAIKEYAYCQSFFG